MSAAPSQPAAKQVVPVTLLVTKKGKPKDVSLPGGSPDWMVTLAQCVLRNVQLFPATQLDAAIDQHAFLEMTFGPAGDAQDRSMNVLSLGPFRTGPRLFNVPGHAMNCYPVGGGIDGESSRFIVTVTIAADGTVSDFKLPEVAAHWMEASARCMLRRIVFYPATNDGQPVQSVATVPFLFEGTKAKVPSPYRITPPRLASSDSEFAAAVQECYPIDLDAGGFVHFAFLITADGTAASSSILEGSGSSRLDDAANCVLKRLRFSPLLIGSQRQNTVVTWSVSMRSPRRPR